LLLKEVRTREVQFTLNKRTTEMLSTFERRFIFECLLVGCDTSRKNNRRLFPRRFGFTSHPEKQI